MSSARLHLRQAQAAPSYFWHLAVVAQCACSAGTDPAAWGHGTGGLTEGSHQDPASQCGCHRVRGSLRGADPTAVVGTRCLPPGNSGCAGLFLLWCPDRPGVAVQQDWGDGDVGLVGANPASPFPSPAALPLAPPLHLLRAPRPSRSRASVQTFACFLPNLFQALPRGATLLNNKAAVLQCLWLGETLTRGGVGAGDGVQAGAQPPRSALGSRQDVWQQQQLPGHEDGCPG